jgi:hypothetical protein
MSLPSAELSAMLENVSSGLYIVWVFRIALGITMLWCVLPSLHSCFHTVVCDYFRSYFLHVNKPAGAKKQKNEEEFVSQQFRLSVSEGDHYNAFKLWQRAKSLDGLSAISLVDVVHMLRSLGKNHEEVVGELRSAFDCNPSLGDGAAEMLDDLRRRGMLGLLGKIISLLKDMGIECSGSPKKTSSCDGCSSDDDVSTQVARSECSTPSETSDDEDEISSPPHSLQHESSSGQIPIATLLALRPLKGAPPVGYLHAAVSGGKQGSLTAQRPSVDRWESLRADGHDLLRGSCRSDRSAPWRKAASDTTAAMTTPVLGTGSLYTEDCVRANKPGSLSSSLVGSTALRPTRKL